MHEIEGTLSPGGTFQKYLDAGEIRLQICDECRRQIFPPRVLCPKCGSMHLRWDVIDPCGQVYSTTTVRQRPDRGGDYNVCIVQLTEGARMLSRVNDVEPDTVSIGDRLSATIDTIDGNSVVAFVRDLVTS